MSLSLSRTSRNHQSSHLRFCHSPDGRLSSAMAHRQVRQEGCRCRCQELNRCFLDGGLGDFGSFVSPAGRGN